MPNYTLRIWTNGDGDFQDRDFASLPELYNAVFETWQPDDLDTAQANIKPEFNIAGGFAVYDNILGTCINSINSAMVGKDKTQAWIPFEPRA
jgi:hypothetical protein